MNSAELNSLKKQMVIKLGTTTNDESAVISNMVDGANAGSLPAVSADDNGKVLKVVDGVWTKAEGGGGSTNVAVCEVTIINTSSTMGRISIDTQRSQFCLNSDGAVIVSDNIPIDANDTIILEFLIGNVDMGGGEPINMVATGQMLTGETEDYTSYITNINNVTIMALPLDNGYGYLATVVDITRPSSFTYYGNYGTI